MDKVGYFFFFGLCLASFTMGGTFPKTNEEVEPWLFRVGVVIALVTLNIRYAALIN